MSLSHTLCRIASLLLQMFNENGANVQDKVMLRLEDSTRAASGPTAEPQEGGASNDDTLLRTGRLQPPLVL